MLLVLDFPGRAGWVSSQELREKWHWDGTALHIAADAETLSRFVQPDGYGGRIRWLFPALLFLISMRVWPSSKVHGKSSCGPRRSGGKLLPSDARPVRKSGFTAVEVLVCLAVVSLLLALIVPAVQSSRERSRQMQCVNHLRQLGQACHGYEAVHRSFPGYLWATNPKKPPITEYATLSVQAKLLPYLDQQTLFDRINQYEDGTGLEDDPPTSALNGELLDAPVPVFLCPSDDTPPGCVSYRGNVGTTPDVGVADDESEPGVAKTGLFVWFTGIRAGQIRDGLSQTVMFGERLTGARNASVLTPSRDIADLHGIPPGNWRMDSPDQAADNCRHVTRTDLPHWSYAGSTWLMSSKSQTLYNHILTPNSTIPDCGFKGRREHFAGVVSLRSYHPRGVNVVMADGSARFINEDIDLQVWRALGSIRGEEVISEF